MSADTDSVFYLGREVILNTIKFIVYTKTGDFVQRKFLQEIFHHPDLFFPGMIGNINDMEQQVRLEQLFQG